MALLNAAARIGSRRSDAEIPVRPVPGLNEVAMAEHLMRCDSCAVRHKAICGALNRGEIERLNAIAHHKTLAPGQVVLHDNSDMSYFANIISGVVKLTKTLADGRQQIVGLQFASDFLGRPFRKQSPYHAEAVTQVHLCTYDKGQFERLVHEFEGFEHRLFEHTLDELDSAREWMLLLGRKSAGEKVASFLLMVSRRMESIGCKPQLAAEPGEIQFNLPLSRAEIADFLGLTIETVSRQISRLKVDKVIGLEGNRTIIVHDLARLRAAAEQERD
jgi:CRP/FNR family transcriptional regulator